MNSIPQSFATPGGPIHYQIADGQWRSPAAELLFGHLGKTDQQAAIRAAERFPNCWDHLWVALAEQPQGSQILDAVWGQVFPGKLAVLITPRQTWESQSGVRYELLGRLLTDLRNASISMVQALTFTDACQSAEMLKQLGFWRVADLLYFVVAAEDLENDARALVEERQGAFYCGDQVEESVWRQVIERTYLNSLDCPGLSGKRPVSDVVASFRGQGEGDPRLWQLLAVEGKPAGCAIMTRHEQDMELLYMGLDPDFRGKGWGRLLFAQACQTAADFGVDRFILAADDRNEPAKKVYIEGGAHVWDRRSAFAKLL